MELADKIAAIDSKEGANTKTDMEGEALEHHARYISENAMIIPAKIAGAKGGDLYGIRMGNAAIIWKVACEIMEIHEESNP